MANQHGMRRAALVGTVALLLATFTAAQEVPAGTLLPVTLLRSLKAGKAKPNDPVIAKLAQYAQIGGLRVPRGTEVTGHVVDSRAASPGSPAQLVLSFDSVKINGHELPITASLRALASMQAVSDAQLPTNLVDDYGSSLRDWNTTQVGGQQVYRGAGTVMDGAEVVGTASVVGEIFGRPQTAVRSACARDAVGDSTQAFWVFSTDACGLYGLGDMKLSHAGRTAPVGQIALESSDKLQLQGGSVFLLVVISAGQPANTAAAYGFVHH